MNIKKVLSLFLVITLLLSMGIACFADDPIVIPDSGEGTEEPAVSPEPTETPAAEPTTAPEEKKEETKPVYPVITKDPTNESVFTGDKAVFIARADNAKTITWYLVSPDGSSTILASSVPQLFPGISVSGANSEKLVLDGVNTKISGYKAYARFGNDEGFADSAAATITVSPSAAPTPTPMPTASPKPTTTPSPVPTATPIPTAKPTATPAVTPRPVYTDNDDSGSSGGLKVGFGTILLLLLSLAVIVGAAIVLSMYVKGQIDLGWLEGIFSGKGKTDDPNIDDDDIPESFYDPDDYKK